MPGVRPVKGLILGMHDHGHQQDVPNVIESPAQSNKYLNQLGGGKRQQKGGPTCQTYGL